MLFWNKADEYVKACLDKDEFLKELVYCLCNENNHYLLCNVHANPHHEQSSLLTFCDHLLSCLVCSIKSVSRAVILGCCRLLFQMLKAKQLFAHNKSM